MDSYPPLDGENVSLIGYGGSKVSTPSSAWTAPVVPWASITEVGSKVSTNLSSPPKAKATATTDPPSPLPISFGVRSQPFKMLLITVSGASEHFLWFRDWAGTQDQEAPTRPFIRKTTWRPLLVEEAGVEVKNAAPS